jgi:hypothetical protein
MSWRNGYGERMGDDEEYNPNRDNPFYREHPNGCQCEECKPPKKGKAQHANQ